MDSRAGRLHGALRRVTVRVRDVLGRTGESPDLLGRIQQALLETTAQGAAGRRWLAAGITVRVDEIETEVGPTRAPTPTPATHGTQLVPASKWARRMVISSRGPAQSMVVVILHRQTLDTPGASPTGRPAQPRRRAFPVIILAGTMGPDDDRRVLSIPDAEEHLPHLTCSDDGRIVVDRGTAHYRPEYQRQFDDLDAIVSGICRDPMVTTLLQDWVSDTERD